MKRPILLCAIFAVLSPLSALAGDSEPSHPAAIAAFLGTGFGQAHEKAPAETEEFGQLVGIWDAEVEMRTQGGSWQSSAPGVWVWKYAIGGFAVSDLWYQGADNLPGYLAHMGRDYLLTANRVYDVANKKWKVAWMANGAGKSMGMDFGTFDANLADGEIVMSSPADMYGMQRVVFYELSEDSFRWKSEYSTDEGKTWNTVMRMLATRRDG